MKQDYVYLLFTNTGTLLTKTIGLYTRAEYNHVSIALDPNLEEVYSFGRKQLHNPFLGGFVRESTHEAFFQKADCSIYACAVSPEQKQKLQEILTAFKNRKDYYQYNLLGLIGVLINLPIPRSNAYFCSQFVAYLLTEAEIVTFDKPPELITPQNIQHIPGLISLYQGKLQGVVFSHIL